MKEEKTAYAKILKTKNYDQFKFRQDNRNINENHVRNLVLRISKENDLHLVPIIVNDEFEVIDGQHRLMAAKQLNESIYYIVDNNFNPEKMVQLNTMQKSWGLNDYLNFYCNHGREDYLKVNEFMKEVDFHLFVLLRWISDDRSGARKIFKLGNFRFRVDEKLMIALQATKKLIGIMKDKNFKPISIYSQGSFHAACKQFFTNPVVNIEQFFGRLEVCPTFIHMANTTNNYLEQFVDIYNWNMKLSRISYVKNSRNGEIK